MTVAVLPLVSTGDSVQRDLAYGLSDEIATALVKVSGVRVMSRRSVANSRDQRTVDTEKTGRELGAQFLVMGSLKEVNGRLTVLASLVQARDGAMVWADQFDRGPDELAVVRDEIAKAVGDSLRVKAGRSSVARPRGQPPRTLIRGVSPLRFGTARAHASRPDHSEERRQLPARHPARLALRRCLRRVRVSRSRSRRTSRGTPPREVAAEVRTTAARALRLDPTLAPPHVALGLVHEHAYAWDSAAVEFQTAVRLRSLHHVEPRSSTDDICCFVAWTADALNQFLTARRTEPALALVSSWVSYTYNLRGQLDSALVESARAFQNDTTSATAIIFGAFARLSAGDTAGALGLANRLPPKSQIGSTSPL